jgi:hypothetical protein
MMGQTRNAYRILIGETLSVWPIGTQGMRWQGSNKMVYGLIPGFCDKGDVSYCSITIRNLFSLLGLIA